MSEYLKYSSFIRLINIESNVSATIIDVLSRAADRILKKQGKTVNKLKIEMYIYIYPIISVRLAAKIRSFLSGPKTKALPPLPLEL